MQLISYYSSRLIINLFRLCWGFSSWHATANYYGRSYKRQVVELANSVKPTSVVEIGCGLGEILVRIKSDSRVGLDIDDKVIKAARIFNILKRGCFFFSGGITNFPKGKVDLVVMVNWLHETPPEIVIKNIADLSQRTEFVIVDQLSPERPGYSYFHNFSFMSQWAQKIRTVDCGLSEGRLLHLFRFTRGV